MTTSIITRGSGVSIAGRQPRGVSPAFSRASVAYQSDGREVGVGVPRFEMEGGRRGVLVEEGTTNLWANANGRPSSLITGGATPPTIELVSMEHPLGTEAWKIMIPAGVTTGFNGCRATTNTAQVTADGRKYSYSCHVKGEPSALDHIRIYPTGTFGMPYVKPVDSLQKGWQRYEGTGSYAPETPWTGTDYLCVYCSVSPNAPITVYLAAIQLEEKPFATSFVNGTRTAESLTVSDVLHPRKGTIECWHRLDYVGGDQYLLANDVNFNAPGHLNVHIGGSFTVAVRLADNSSLYNKFPAYKVNAEEWQHWALAYDADAGMLDLYIDGHRVTDGAQVDISTINLNTTLHLSGHKGNMTYGASGARADLRVHCRALSDAEITAHAAGNIVASDCYHYPFDGDLWPAPGSLGAVVAPAVTERPRQVDVATCRGGVDITTRPGKLEVIGR